MDVEVYGGLIIPAAELSWRFSRSSGPGGQHVNTSDTRVELSWDVVRSGALTEEQRARLTGRLARRLAAGVLTVSVSENRSQLRNRETAARRLAELVAGSLAPDAPARRPTRPTRGSKRRHLAAKQQRSETKRLRHRPTSD